MPTPTYTLISETVLGSSSVDIVFNSIPQTYKHLIIESLAQDARTGGNDFNVQFNSDTSSGGTNYSITFVRGDGSTASSGRGVNTYAINFGQDAGSNQGYFSVITGTIFDYTNTNIFKSTLSRGSHPGGSVSATVGLWRSTAAINSIRITGNGYNLSAGMIVRLWGVVG